VAAVKAMRGLLLLATLTIAGWLPQARSAATDPTEQQLKAVFVFNFSHFVAWPPESFSAPTEPFVIGVLGGDAIAAQLEEAVRTERLDSHPLVVKRLNSAADIQGCRILYIDRSQGAQLDRILAQLPRRDTLTVSDLAGAAERGVAIELANENNRVKLVINADSARNAGLTISSNLLRLARVARTRE
jgi:hypothetical protein